jgi:hypothetical protein
MFTDAEVADNTRKVLRRNDIPSAITQIQSPIAVPASVEEIERAVVERFLNSPT